MSTDEHGIRQRQQGTTSATLARAYEAFTGLRFAPQTPGILGVIAEIIDECDYQDQRWGWEHDAQHDETDWDDLTLALRAELSGALFEMALARAIATTLDDHDRARLAEASIDAARPRAYWIARARHAAICLAATCATLVVQLDAGTIGREV
jgi:hypothetical protein